MIDVLMSVSKWVNLVEDAVDCCSESRGVESVPVVNKLSIVITVIVINFHLSHLL